MPQSEYNHLLGRQRGTVLGVQFSARHQRNVRAEAAFEAPGRYNLRAAPSAELARSAGQPSSSFTSRAPRLAPHRLAAKSTAEELSLERESDPWHKRNNTRLPGGFMSSLGRAKAHRACRAGMARDFRDPDYRTNPKMAECEARRGPARQDNFLTTPKGCFAHGRWMSEDERSAGERRAALSAAVPRLQVPLDAGGEAVLRPEDGGEGGSPAVTEQIAQRETRARALDPLSPQCALVGWREAQGGRSDDARWAKSEHGMTKRLRSLMFSY